MRSEVMFFCCRCLPVLLCIHSCAFRTIQVEVPSDLPEREFVEGYYEPTVMASIVTPSDYVGNLFQLFQARRGIQQSIDYVDEDLVELKYLLPWQEVAVDLYDVVKSQTKGYASFDYKPVEPTKADVVRVSSGPSCTVRYLI